MSDNQNRGFSYKGSGTNSQGNHYCSRNYGPGAPNSNAYHYSNGDGSYYYNNPNGSSYYNNGQGGATYTPSQGQGGQGQGGQGQEGSRSQGK